ncbi:hypothetical protein [Nonomuraea endophytica]|uniref:Uncharacterized protein n=1 Tax=Nonomuraea endophytica TaxID=714136 RepID=A0A7W8A8K9_9ACTN|nr:hypothetical protein [Nonomuraea endophytica]MBB5081555.1 hypothetical protein [Nonomuraea endophytica]
MPAELYDMLLYSPRGAAGRSRSSGSSTHSAMAVARGSRMFPIRRS